MELLLGFNVEVLHNSCNTCTRVLPDMYTLIPQAITDECAEIFELAGLVKIQYKPPCVVVPIIY